MADPVDVGSLVGTWVGAGVGVIALFALLGPLLIWLASRTERQKTIDAIGRDNNNYISPGWHLGPNIYLGQRVRAPLLKTTGVDRPFANMLQLNADTLADFDTKATWIQFGALLESYKIPVRRGDSLVIKNQKAYLPVHPSYVLIVGLLGRYSPSREIERSQGQKSVIFRLQSSNQSVRRMQNRLPQQRYVHPQSRSPPRQSLPPPPTQDYPAETFIEREDFTILYGNTGGLKAYESHGVASDVDHPVINFLPSATVELRAIAPEVLPPKDILLLAMGFLHLGENSYASLMELSEEVLVDYYSESEIEDFHLQGRSRRPGEGIYEISQPRRDRDRWASDFVLYRLGHIDELDEKVIDMGQPFFDSATLSFAGLMSTSDPASQSTVAGFIQTTFLPADSEWVRVSPYSDVRPEPYMLRTDAQKLALALLNLRWHPEGYLVAKQGNGPAMSLLTAVSVRLVGLMGRILEKYRFLSLGQEDQKKLSAALQPVFRNLEKEQSDRRSSRQVFRLMYQLDETLNQLGRSSGPNQLVTDRVIGILCLTNHEFLDLIHRSVRNLRDTTEAGIQLDLRSTTLKVPSVFGVTQHFPVDLDRISPDEERSHETTSVSYTVVVLVALRSLLKSQMLKSCLDADPLLDLVAGWDDLVYVH